MATTTLIAATWPGNARAERAANGGWEGLAGGLPRPLAALPYALLTDQAAPGHLYAGLGNGDAWHSDDYGDAWRRLP